MQLTKFSPLFLFIFLFIPFTCSDSNWVGSVVNDGDVKVLDNIDGNYVVKEEDDVVILTRENFNHVVHNKEYILVEFYAPWCTHCKMLTPEYAKAAQELKSKNLTLAKVDATVETDLAKEHMITGFPTITLFLYGIKQEEYSGERTGNSIVNYLLARTDPEWKPPPTSVIDLDSENFVEFLESKPLVLVFFYADYCQHCQQMKPEYINAAKTLKEYGVPLTQIDGVANKDIADEYKIKGWPTLMLYRHGRAFEYKGTRDEKGIVSYMRDQLKSPTTECKSRKEIENRIERYIPTVIGVFKNEQSKFFQEYFATANYLRGEPIKFLHTFSAKAMEYLKVNGEAVIVKKAPVFISDYENAQEVFSDSSKTGDDIADFIRANYRPLVGQRTKENRGLFYSSRPLIVVYYDANFEHQHQKASEIIRSKVVEVAKDFKFLTFAVANEDDFQDELSAVKLDDSGTDVNVVWYDHNRLKYRMEPVDDFDGSDLRTFVNLANDDKLQPVWKSLPIPAKQDGPVQVVVADNFESVVLKSKEKRDVVLYIGAPWCGYCKTFDKTYKSLAKRMGSEKLLFTKMDGVSNDLLPGFEIKGYPTIFFLPNNKKHEPALYDGDRTYNDVKKFIDKHSSIWLTEEERDGLNKVEL